jgi:hypothetical protein
MKLTVVAVYDSKAEHFHPPVYGRTPAEAIRGFGSACRADGNPLGEHPEDFQLMLVGEFDQASGVLTGREPMVIARATEFAAIPDNRKLSLLDEIQESGEEERDAS